MDGRRKSIEQEERKERKSNGRHICAREKWDCKWSKELSSRMAGEPINKRTTEQT